MSTRGIMGFRVNGVDHLSYNHSDSYPGWLGAKIFNDLKELLGDWGLETLKENAQAVRLVTDDSATPTPEEMETHCEHFDGSVSTGSPDEWYTLLRELQGELRKTIVAGYMIDSHNFVYDSLFCEWGYIVNLDDEVLEIYQGFQKAPHDKGRYALSGISGAYYPIALTATIPFAELPENEGEFLLIADNKGTIRDYMWRNKTIDAKTAMEMFDIELPALVELLSDEYDIEQVDEFTVRVLE